MSASHPTCHHLHPPANRCGSPALRSWRSFLLRPTLCPTFSEVSGRAARRTKNVPSPRLTILETSHRGIPPPGGYPVATVARPFAPGTWYLAPGTWLKAVAFQPGDSATAPRTSAPPRVDRFPPAESSPTSSCYGSSGHTPASAAGAYPLNRHSDSPAAHTRLASAT